MFKMWYTTRTGRILCLFKARISSNDFHFVLICFVELPKTMLWNAISSFCRAFQLNRTMPLCWGQVNKIVCILLQTKHIIKLRYISYTHSWPRPFLPNNNTYSHFYNIASKVLSSVQFLGFKQNATNKKTSTLRS